MLIGKENQYLKKPVNKKLFKGAALGFVSGLMLTAVAFNYENQSLNLTEVKK